MPVDDLSILHLDVFLGPEHHMLTIMFSIPSTNPFSILVPLIVLVT